MFHAERRAEHTGQTSGALGVPNDGLDGPDIERIIVGRVGRVTEKGLVDGRRFLWITGLGPGSVGFKILASVLLNVQAGTLVGLPDEVRL